MAFVKLIVLCLDIIMIYGELFALEIFNGWYVSFDCVSKGSFVI